MKHNCCPSCLRRAVEVAGRVPLAELLAPVTRHTVDAPSALHGLSLVLGTLADNMDAEGWRPSFRRLRATSNDRKGKDSTVEVTIDLSLFGESDTEARRDYESWLSRIEAQPWCLKVDRRATTPLENGKGIATSGLKISVDPKKAEVL